MQELLAQSEELYGTALVELAPVECELDSEPPQYPDLLRLLILPLHDPAQTCSASQSCPLPWPTARQAQSAPAEDEPAPAALPVDEPPGLTPLEQELFARGIARFRACAQADDFLFHALADPTQAMADRESRL